MRLGQNPIFLVLVQLISVLASASSFLHSDPKYASRALLSDSASLKRTLSTATHGGIHLESCPVSTSTKIRKDSGRKGSRLDCFTLRGVLLGTNMCRIDTVVGSGRQPSPGKRFTKISQNPQKQRALMRRDVALGAVKFRNFDEMLISYHDTPVLVAFHSKLCGPCKLMHKELQLVRDSFDGQVQIFNIDTEKFPSLGSRFEVEGLPTTVLFKYGHPVHRIEGVEKADEVVRQVRGHL